MSVPFEQSNNLVPVRVAAKHSGYTTDYITRLAREGKVVAEKHGRQWLVDLYALQQFARAVQQQNAVRKELLRQERRREHLRSQSQGESIFISYTEAIDAGRVSAWIQTALISSIAGMIALAQISVVSPVQVSNQLANTSDVGTALLASLEGTALALYHLVHPEAATVAGGGSWGGATASQPVRAYSFTVLSEEEASSVVEDGFSDEVDVTFDVETPGAGVVIPQFKSREDSAYRFQIFLEKTSGTTNVDIE